MFMRWLVFMALAPSIAVAQVPAPSAPTQSMPAEPRFENDCTHLYPAAAAEIGAQGVTLVSVRIAANGSIQNAHVAQTSGNADLDKAALACVSDARTKPITSGGTPIEADTQIGVVWQRSYFTGAPAPAFRNLCSSGSYPPIAVRLNHQGEVALSFTIAEGGTVKNVTVVKSSGYDELDQAAIACVTQFRYRPVIQNGKPIAIDGTTVVKWLMR
jgi:TonB family protein